MNEQTVSELLELEYNVHERKLEGKHAKTVLQACLESNTASAGMVAEGESDSRHATALRLHACLRQLILKHQERIVFLKKRDSDFRVAYSRTIAEEDRRELILGFAKDLGASKRTLRGDRKAFARYFGEDAIRDRYVRRLNDTERELNYCLNRFGVLTAFIIRNIGAARDKQQLWVRIGVEETIKPLLAYEGDSRVVCTAFKALSRSLRELPIEVQESSVEESTLQFIYRSAMQARQDVWIQCESLKLLSTLSPRSLQRVLERRLGQPGDDEDLFLRRKAVVLLGENLARLPDLENMIPIVLRDPSPYVRQGLASVISILPLEMAKRVVRELALKDDAPAVRAFALCEGITLLERPELELSEELVAVLRRVLEKDQASFVLRVALRVASDGGRFLRDGGSPFFSTWLERLLPVMDDLHGEADDLSVRRWAAEARERLWSYGESHFAELEAALSSELKLSGNGNEFFAKNRLLADLSDDEMGRWLSTLAQQDFGFDVSRGRFRTRLGRGHTFGFRLWRTIHEFRNPSPDKRQAHPHTIGRLFRGDLRVPSAILSELAQTKVPGEPLFMGDEQGWRPFLPLVDDVLSSIHWTPKPRPVRIYTAEGVTEICAPSNVAQRAAAQAKLTWSFADYAKLRNWREQDGGSPKDYVEALRTLGFAVDYQPHSQNGVATHVDPSVQRFFPLALPILDPDFWDQVGGYFVSVYENSLYELAVFAGLASSIFVGRHFAANYSLKKARENIPLVIGGWGTRGKSGTERLKAALFSALGYGFVSKTTGCEAMFLYAQTFGKTREMFLFRPYDKATIWEQRNVVQIAEKLGTDVFLWECMGLTPSYVEILQRHWMRDDIATITNTYPDHEDLQGPAGVDIPKVMCDFIPANSILYSSEEQMLPILVEASRKYETKLFATGWLESGLLPDDVLNRFPYEEHPFNIALVLGMAEELGIDRDYALKEMADKVVADIGVLKTYPPAPMRSRQMEFTNGMSANERHGCLGNWTRLGFDQLDPVEDPDKWICTVVNNRSDRIARSRVFADLLVRDVEADRHVLIGNNLMGLRGYIREAWESYAESVSLVHESDDGVTTDPQEVFRGYYRKLRMPFEEHHITVRLRKMLENQNVPLNLDALVDSWRDPDALHSQLVDNGLASVADDIASYARDMGECLEDYVSFSKRIGGGTGLDEELRELLWKWFSWKIVVVDDYFATGNQVVDRICSATPPGFYAKIMGLQNIKGTGLDFVYRWQAWETCYDACKLLRSPDVRDAERGLKELSSFREYGVLSDEYARETLEIVRRSPAAQKDRFVADLETAESNLTTAMRVINEQASSAGEEEQTSSGGGQWLERICSVFEEFFDAGDAVKRRKVASRIYKDLINERISSERAALELSALNKRQKGGWLLKRVKSAQEVLARKATVLQPKR